VTVLGHINLLFWRVAYKVLLHRGRSMPVPQSLRDIERAVLLAALDYKPAPYAGRVVYFKRGVLPDLTGIAATFGWGPLLARGLEIYETTGRHGDMFHSPHVEPVAAKVRELLAETRAGHAAEELDENIQAAIR
ncbi:MAG: uncharacterized protein JWO80_4742, partial [Bryobacterales bacterium]|nr:uncharacterized protein [Bryobacterales bacterium]